MNNAEKNGGTKSIAASDARNRQARSTRSSRGLDRKYRSRQFGPSN
jgi:hypothetical protein